MIDESYILKIINEGMEKRDRSVSIFFAKDGQTHVSVYHNPEEELDISKIKEARELIGKCIDTNSPKSVVAVYTNIVGALSLLDKFIRENEH